MTVSEAARLAEVNVKTWTAIEGGSRATRDTNYAKIERALRWQPGSVEAVQGGSPAQLLPENGEQESSDGTRYFVPGLGEIVTDPQERGLWDLDPEEYPERVRLGLIFRLREDRAQQQAREWRRRAAG